MMGLFISLNLCMPCPTLRQSICCLVTKSCPILCNPMKLQYLRFPCPSLSPRICEGQTHVLLVRDGLFCCCLVISHFQLFCDPMDGSPPGSSVHGISQARMLEWVAISFSPGDLPDPGIKFTSPALQMDSLPLSHLGSPMVYLESSKSLTSFSMYVWLGIHVHMLNWISLITLTLQESYIFIVSHFQL